MNIRKIRRWLCFLQMSPQSDNRYASTFLLPQWTIALLGISKKPNFRHFSQEFFFFFFSQKVTEYILHSIAKILLYLFLRVWICPTSWNHTQLSFIAFLYLFPLSANGGGTRRTHNESLVILKAPPCRSLYFATICFFYHYSLIYSFSIIKTLYFLK